MSLSWPCAGTHTHKCASRDALCGGHRGQGQPWGSGTRSMSPPRLPSLQAPVAAGSGPARPPVPSPCAGAHLWLWDLVSPAPQLPGDTPPPAPSPGSRGSQRGEAGVPEPHGCSTSPPILGTSGSKCPGPGGTRGHFLPLPGPKVSSQTPKNSRELVFSHLPPALPLSGTPLPCVPGGDRHPTGWVSPTLAGTPHRAQLPRERWTTYFLDKSPGSKSPHSHPPTRP